MKFIDLSGKRFGRLQVLKRVSSEKGRTRFLCKCDCGNETNVGGEDLKRGQTRSCGCLLREIDEKKFIDLTGKRFGRLIVLKRVPHPKSNHSRFLCKCDCGKEKEVYSDILRRGLTKSCGCLVVEHSRRGYPPGESGLNELYGRYKRNALKGKKEFKLTLDEFRILTKQNCYYCGDIPHAKSSGDKRTPKIDDKDSYGTYIYNGVDRIDSEKGYTTDNVVPCCTTCNHMKLDYTKEYFINHINKIINNLKKGNLYVKNV